MRLTKIIIATIVIAGLTVTGCTGSQKRGLKSFESNMAGGLNRTITLYDQTGKEIRHWTGKIDISDSPTETDFMIDGKRVIIHGGISVIEEK